MRKVLGFLLLGLGILAMAAEGGSSSSQGGSASSLASPKPELKREGPKEDLPNKVQKPEVRHRGPDLGKVNPRGILVKRGGKWSIELPYVSVGRKDMTLLNANDPDCPRYDPEELLKTLKRPELAEFRPWQDDKLSDEKKLEAIRQRAEQMRDGRCAKTVWHLPYSSVLATQQAAAKLKRAWERFEDRYFWRVVTDLNNPVYYIPYCMLGFGIENFSQGERPPIDFIPPGALPPELGSLLGKEILDLTSSFKERVKANAGSFVDDHYGLREATPNYRAEGAGEFRKPLYFPFVPSIKPSEFCDGMGFKIPVLYIPAISISFCGITVFESPGYPDRPWIFDQGEADARIKGAAKHAYSKYYPEYLTEVLTALLPMSNLGDYASKITDELSNLAQGNLSNLAGVLKDLDGFFYFPVPWQAPILGGGAVVTPVYDFLYPDALRVGIDVLTIYDMVGALLNGESLSFLEKVALAMYYLEPVLEYLDQPLLPGIVDIPLRKTPVGQAVDALYGSIRAVAETALRGFYDGIDATASAAFGNALGPAFASGARILLKPIEEIFAFNDPRYFVSKTLELMVNLDRFAATFNLSGHPEGTLFNRVNGVIISPGLWRFEELKRVFPPSSPLTQRLFGYASFFGAWNEFAITVIPDMFANWANPAEYTLALLSRLIGYWHVPFRINFCPFSLPQVYPEIPRYMPLAPYFVPFIGERTTWGWFSVPEGYVLPLAKGLPGGVLPSLGKDHPLNGQSEFKVQGFSIIDFYEEIVLGLKPGGGQ